MALNPRKLIIVGAGAVCSALVVIMLLNVALRPSEKTETAKTGTEVMIATKAMKAGEVVDAKNAKWQAWDEDRIYDGLVTRKAGDEDTKTEGKLRRDVSAGEPLTRSAMVDDKDGTMLATKLEPGMRAVGVKVTAEASAGGFVLPGDHVDVVLSHEIEVKRDSPEENIAEGLVDSNASETILENVTVLAVDQNADKNESAKVGRTVTLQVTPKQAEILLLGARMGELSLTLRGLMDPKDETAVAEGESKTETPKRDMTTDLEVSRILGRLHSQIEGGGPVQNVRIYNSVAVDSRVYAVQMPRQADASQ